MKVKLDKEISKKDQQDIQKVISLLEGLRSNKKGLIHHGVAEDALANFVQALEDEGLATCENAFWRCIPAKGNHWRTPKNLNGF